MMILPVRTIPDPVLRQKARNVSRVTDKTRELLQNMVETMRDEPGVGLAAPQVGISERLIVVEYTEESEDSGAAKKPSRLYQLVNPEIVRHSRDTVEGNEGCLSIPGYLGTVDRYRQVTIKGLNQYGDPVRIKASDWLARVFQHEIDHLDGVLYIDRASEMFELVEEQEETEAVQA
ncbi:MAG: peptide deformylase [Anaerolineales bacterium]|nr:peptide deformylase [Anaerolineales bacterium]